MDELKDWAVALCAAAVLCAGAGMLAPDEKKLRGMKMVMASVMLCAVVLPLTRMSGCDTHGLRPAAEYTPDSRLCAALERQTASSVSGAVRDLAAGCLDDSGITWQDISVSVDISDDGCISIGQIAVTVPDANSGEASLIADILLDRLGLRAEVISQEESKWN